MTITLRGTGVSPGRVVAPAAHMADPVEPPSRTPSLLSRDEERGRFTTARDEVRSLLEVRAAAVGGEAADVLGATALMAGDPALEAAVSTAVDTGATAEVAVWDAARQLADQLESLGGYLAERAADVLDVRARIVCSLRGIEPPGIPDLDHPFVLVAEDLAPADTATLDPAKVRGIVTVGGGTQSHTAILARSLGIAAVVGVRSARDLADGQDVYVDGLTGEVAPAGDDHRAAAVAWDAAVAARRPFSGEARLADGETVRLVANVGNVVNAIDARAMGARGVGLFRTELAFLEATHEPDVTEQTATYRSVLEQFVGGAVVVRTLDAGADKPLAFLTASDEPNPALGVRGLRTAVEHEDVLQRQLQALVQAANGLDVSISAMAPMVATVEEAEQVSTWFKAAGIERVGVMIETPSAALMAEEILRVVDFVSLGTNDLTQYTMAADRELAALAALQDPWQPAVLRLIRHVAAAGRAVRRGEGAVGVCGEAAADPALAVVLVGLGIDSLSMSPRSLAAVAQLLGTVTRERAELVAAHVLAASTASGARAAAHDALPELAELGF